jgi:hypothetical protein
LRGARRQRGLSPEVRGQSNALFYYYLMWVFGRAPPCAPALSCAPLNNYDQMAKRRKPGKYKNEKSVISLKAQTFFPVYLLPPFISLSPYFHRRCGAHSASVRPSTPRGSRCRVPQSFGQPALRPVGGRQHSAAGVLFGQARSRVSFFSLKGRIVRIRFNSIRKCH